MTNLGTDSIGGGYWYDYVYLSKDQTYDFTDSYVASNYRSGSPPLGAGESYTISQTATLPGVAAGDYYLLFITDQYDYVAETNEDNNVKAVPITLTASSVDLIVTAADAPANADAGGPANVSWTVKNQGTDAAASSWYDYVYLSTDATYDPFDSYVTSSYAGSSVPLAPGTVTRARDSHAPLGAGRLVLPALLRRRIA